jgi:dTDP-4-amino-4,6-dideoxygalactose transaminase
MIPLVDLKPQYRSLKPDIDAAVARVLESGQFVLGPEVAAFEEEFAAYAGGTHAVAVGSGTCALHLALLAAGIGPGDEVITVPFTFVATVAAIEYAGATPVFVDIETRYCTIDVKQIACAITPRTKAIVPVHLYGHAADLERILELAARHHLVVIEDAAQAHGATYQGRCLGTFGQFGCFSFYPSKILGGYGEGGLVLTNDPAHAALLRQLRDWGQAGKYEHVIRGFNYRMDALQAAVLRVKLRYLDAWVEARRRHAAQYDALLANTDVQAPAARPGTRHAYATYTIRSSQRDQLRERLRAAEIETNVHYPTPIHLQPAYKHLGYHAGDFPEAERAACEVLSLPMYPELSAEQVETVCRAIRASVSARPVESRWSG